MGGAALILTSVAFNFNYFGCMYDKYFPPRCFLLHMVPPPKPLVEQPVGPSAMVQHVSQSTHGNILTLILSDSDPLLATGLSTGAGVFYTGVVKV